MAAGEKTKRRNSEKRKEKSRDAARTRRTNEAEIMAALAQELPLPYSMLNQLDKASIIRLSICLLKLTAVLRQSRDNVKERPSPLNTMLDPLYGKAIDGFLMVLSSCGDLLYVSDSVLPLLGLLQVDMLGQSVYDYIHPCDHEEVREQIGSDKMLSEHNCLFSVRIKSGVNNKTTGPVNINKQTSYKMIHCCGKRLALQEGSLEKDGSMDNKKSGDTMVSVTVVTGQLIPHPSDVVNLDCRSFISHHSLDMKFISCDDRVSKLLGYEPCELLGSSAYNYHHALDGDLIEKSYKTLLTKGEMITGMYRFLTKSGGYVWLETTAALITNQRTDKPHSIICSHCVISEVESAGVILSGVQQSQVVELESEDCKPVCQIDAQNEHVRYKNAVADERLVEILDDRQVSDEDSGGNVISIGDEEDEDVIHFVTEQILNFSGLADALEMSQVQQLLDSDKTALCQLTDHNIFKSATKDSMSESSMYDVIEGQVRDYEMKAPYIPMDDMMFSTPLEEVVGTTIGQISEDTSGSAPLHSVRLTSNETVNTERRSLAQALNDKHVCSETLILDVDSDRAWIKETEEWLLNLKNWKTPPSVLRKRSFEVLGGENSPPVKQLCIVPPVTHPPFIQQVQQYEQSKNEATEALKPTSDQMLSTSHELQVASNGAVYVLSGAMENECGGEIEQEVNEEIVIEEATSELMDSIIGSTSEIGSTKANEKITGYGERGGVATRHGKRGDRGGGYIDVGDAQMHPGLVIMGPDITSSYSSSDEIEDGERSDTSGSSEEIEGSSVLKNLLLKGEDISYGYRLKIASAERHRQLAAAYSLQMSASSGRAKMGTSFLHQLLCSPQQVSDSKGQQVITIDADTLFKAIILYQQEEEEKKKKMDQDILGQHKCHPVFTA